MRPYQILPLLLLGAAAAPAQTAVDFGSPDYVTANATAPGRSYNVSNNNIQLGGVDPGDAGTIGALPDRYRQMAVDEATANVVGSVKYYTAGYFRVHDFDPTTNNNRPFTRNWLLEGGTGANDYISLSSNTGAVLSDAAETAGAASRLTGGKYQALVYWKAADFLAPIPVGAVEGAVFTAAVRVRDAASDVPYLSTVYNFVIQAGGTYYASADKTLATRATANGFQQITHTMAAADLWRPIGFNTTLDVSNPDYITLGTASTLDLGTLEVQAVGILAQTVHDFIDYNTATPPVAQASTAGFDMNAFSFVGPSAPSGYAAWATANGIDGEPAGGDFDGDGHSNLIEYAIAGLDPTVPDGAIETFDGTTVSYAKRAEAVTNGDVIYAIEASEDLGATLPPWPAVTPTVNDGSTIAYDVAATPREFARLSVSLVE